MAMERGAIARFRSEISCLVFLLTERTCISGVGSTSNTVDRRVDVGLCLDIVWYLVSRVCQILATEMR